MITLKNLPEDYQPYTSLTICSNTLLGGGHIVAVGETLPIVIGKGVKPQIWLQAMSAPNSKEFVSIIESSVSKHPAVEVLEEEGAIVVTIQGSKVLVVKAVSDQAATVLQLDLRPIGLNLFGDQSSLTAGGSTLSNNTMSGGAVLIGFGE